MSKISTNFPRGSEWRIWDLHIHSPASFHWDGARLHDSMDENARNALIDQMIDALNTAEPAVFALMDYWTFDGWFALKKRQAQPGAPQLTKTVFPGIELRLAAPMPGRLNAHVIFSNEIPDQDLRDFKGRLTLEIVNRPLSDDGLRAFARQAGEDQLKKHGFTKEEVDTDEDRALLAGCQTAELSRESYTRAVRDVPHGRALGFMPFDTNDGLADVRWSEHYSFVLDLFHFSPIFETRNMPLRAAFVGAKIPQNAKWYDSFRAALKHIPRLAVSGSDAHRFKGTPGDNNKRGYGDFPSQTKTWIKADPTWLGLLQAIKEPEKRSFIGVVPPKLDFVGKNPSFYIDRLEISKVDGSRFAHDWLHGCDVELNTDLVAVIGNKGSGKSAFADIVALLGNSQQSGNFQFLTKERFRGKTGEPARHFHGRLSWRSGTHGEMLLSDNPPENRVELVRYIPQHRFEALCNDHVMGRSSNFEKELRSVIFSHVDKSVSLGALDFDQLIEQQEAGFRANLIELRTALQSLNAEILAAEDQLNPSARVVLEEMLALKRAELEQHHGAKPEEVPAPSGALTPDQTTANTRLAEIAARLAEIDASTRLAGETIQTIALKRRAIRNIRDRTAILNRQFSDFSTAISADLTAINIPLPALVDLTVRLAPLTALEQALEATEADTKVKIAADTQAKEPLETERAALGVKLDEPQQRYQKYLADLA